MNEHGHLEPEPPPDDERLPWWIGLAWRTWVWVTWPSTVRAFKAEGFRRTGWMRWEAGPRHAWDDDQ